MHENDDLTAMTDKELAKWHAEAIGRSECEILAKNEWRMRPIREQHRLNTYLVIITVIATLIAAILGGLIQRYGLDFIFQEKTSHTHIETQQSKGASTVATVPQTKQGAASTTNESSSLQPPKEQNKKR
jgi:hypothetical protein